MLIQTFMAAYRVQTLNISSRQKASRCCDSQYFRRCQVSQFPAPMPTVPLPRVPKIQLCLLLDLLLGHFYAHEFQDRKTYHGLQVTDGSGQASLVPAAELQLRPHVKCPTEEGGLRLELLLSANGSWCKTSP